MGTEGYDFEHYSERVEARRKSIRAVTAGDDEIAQDWLSRTSGERAVPIMAALKDDANQYEEAVNVVNMGAIPNLPCDAIVEVPVIVSASGVQPIQVPPLPEGIAALCKRQIAIQELVVEAALTGGREVALQALVLDPVVPDLETARTILDELLTVHASYLPKFA